MPIPTKRIDKLVVEPARLGICTLLYIEEEVSFDRLIEVLELTAGNLAGHMRKLEEAGYVEVSKGFIGRRPRTTYKLTKEGKKAFEETVNQLRYIVGLSRVLPKA